MRNRASGFRYERDNTLKDLQRQLYETGTRAHQFSTAEYVDGSGTYMICIDTDSDDAFEDVVSRMRYRKAYGIGATYVRATRLYLDMYVTVQTAHEVDYTDREKQTIYYNINEMIQKFFISYCVVGSDLRINALKAALNNALSDFDIANIDIEIANNVVINKEKNIVEVGNTTKAYPNKVLTSLEYVGGGI